MTAFLVPFFVYLCALSAIFFPVVGVFSYYLLGILGPQYIWYWAFPEGLRASFIIAVCSILGVLIKTVSDKDYNINNMFNPQNIYMALLWLSIFISYHYGPYVNHSFSGGINSDFIYSVINSIFIFYFISSLEINSLNKIFLIFGVMVFSSIYLIYWANMQYFSQNWFQFNWGRLMGPAGIRGESLYKDENLFAMLFVSGLPFIYYLSVLVKKKFFRYLLILIIPFGWHAVFLTGSRGGLLGISSVMLCVLFLSDRKKLIVPILIIFLVFYQFQAGDVMHSRSTQITNIEGESSANERLTAWHGGWLMIQAHPIFGVGLGGFAYALPNYIDSKKMVAHNTFIQYVAESGIFAGLAFLGVVITFFRNFRAVRISIVENRHLDNELLFKFSVVNNAVFVSFLGVFICSFFLSLNAYEIFYFLILLNTCLYSTYFRWLRSLAKRESV